MSEEKRGIGFLFVNNYTDKKTGEKKMFLNGTIDLPDGTKLELIANKSHKLTTNGKVYFHVFKQEPFDGKKGGTDTEEFEKKDDGNVPF